MKKLYQRLHDEPMYFIATLFRWAFALLFIFVAIKKFRMGYPEFVDSIVNADTDLGREIPDIFLMLYAYLLPAAEFIVGIMLLINKGTDRAYQIIALIYLTFIFGQEYNGNTSKVGTEYLPSLTALAVAYYANYKVTRGKSS